MPELIELARQENIGDVTGVKRHDLVFRILKERVKLNGLMFGEGTLEILPDGFGFLRSPDYHYLSCPDDIYVSPSQIRRFGLRNGMSVAGQIRPPKETERDFALLRRGGDQRRRPGQAVDPACFFDELTPLHPDERIVLETTADEIAMRVVDLVVPIGFGQRGLDRQSAPGRQDDPPAEDGQGRARELPRSLRHHAARSTSGRRRSPTWSGR